jgi:general stress protein CsbA
MVLVLDFDKIREIGLKGVRRAAVFMGLGLNAASDPNFKSYQLHTLQSVDSQGVDVEFIPSNVDDHTLLHFKTEFGTWILGNGLREVIENFAVFLDGIHHACLSMACSKKRLQPKDAEKRDRSFRFKGVEDKLRDLKAKFNIEPPHSDYIASINQARNCLTHRLGRVGLDDCKDGRFFEVRWTGMDVQIQFQSGNTRPLKEMLNVKLPEPGRVQVRFAERTKSFPVGSVVTFSKIELSEICNFVLTSINAVASAALQYAKSIGVVIKDSAKATIRPSSKRFGPCASATRFPFTPMS